MSTFSNLTTTSGHQLVSQTGGNLGHVPSLTHLASLYHTTHELGAPHTPHTPLLLLVFSLLAVYRLYQMITTALSDMSLQWNLFRDLYNYPITIMCCTGRYDKRQWDSRESDEEEDNCEVDVVSSLESLSLSESHRSDFNPQTSTPFSILSCSFYRPRTCRQEALWEDITVDDLAGYMDQLLYLDP